MYLALAWVLAGSFPVDLRTRVEPFKGSGEWREVTLAREFKAAESAIIICDMWDRHWCGGATRRVDAMAGRMNAVLEKARKAGFLIVHAPSDVMDFYKDAPQRRYMLALEKVVPPAPLGLADPPLPIDDKAGGCDTGESFYKAWTRQHPALRIDARDVISDKGDEIYSLLRKRGVGTVFIMGVHTNMCVLNRTFAIKRMTNWGLRCVLVRDLTDAMYDPKARPFVSHERGTEMVIEHIEKYWCPTVLSTDLLRSLEK
jgi:nicotinamidase-related amidase